MRPGLYSARERNHGHNHELFPFKLCSRPVYQIYQTSNSLFAGKFEFRKEYRALACTIRLINNWRKQKSDSKKRKSEPLNTSRHLSADTAQFKQQ
jgi:hypothetical protein